MDAEQFVAEVLAERIGAAGVITGDDFSFGKGRSGDAALLARLGPTHGVAAEAVPQVLLDGERISSGRIREALVEGDTGTATRMLSRDYAIEGVVQRGDARGRELGYPTANLASATTSGPKYGIYAVRVTLDDGSEHPGVASLGVRPTFEPPQELLEAHLFDFERRPLRPEDRGRAPRLHPRRAEVRDGGGAGRANAGRRGEGAKAAGYLIPPQPHGWGGEPFPAEGMVEG